jgi:hypothetical protein
VGRGHLIRAAALGASLSALALPAGSTGATISWRTISDGPTSGAAVRTATGYVALDRAAARSQLAGRLPAGARARVATVDFSRDALVGIFGEFGCSDSRVAVTSIAQRGATLSVRLVTRPPAPGTVECMALYPTYRLLLVPKASLTRPYPTRAVVTGA